MLGNLGGWHLLVLLAVVLLVFGAAKLPALAKSVAQSAKILKTEMRTPADQAASSTAESSTPVSSSAEGAVTETAAPQSPVISHQVDVTAHSKH